MSILPRPASRPTRSSSRPPDRFPAQYLERAPSGALFVGQCCRGWGARSMIVRGTFGRHGAIATPSFAETGRHKGVPYGPSHRGRTEHPDPIESRRGRVGDGLVPSRTTPDPTPSRLQASPVRPAWSPGVSASTSCGTMRGSVSTGSCRYVMAKATGRLPTRPAPPAPWPGPPRPRAWRTGSPACSPKACRDSARKGE